MDTEDDRGKTMRGDNDNEASGAQDVPLEERDINDLEVQMWQAVQRRAKTPGGLPDRDTLFAMEEPVYRLLGASLLFADLAVAVDFAGHRIDPVKPRGLVFLAQAMEREAERLHRLYYGRRPDRRLGEGGCRDGGIE